MLDHAFLSPDVRTVVLFDLDGVLSPLPDMRPDAPSVPRQYAGDSWDLVSTSGFLLPVARRVVPAVAALSSRGDVHAALLSSWHHGARRALADLGLPPLTSAASDEELTRGGPTWWKAWTVTRRLRDLPATTHVVWVDDDLDRYASLDRVLLGEPRRIPAHLITHPRLHLVSPDARRGLSPLELLEITDICDRTSRLATA